MPQIQVIERQPDPVAARIAETGNVVADALKQKQLLKMEQLKIRNEMSQTENETRKIELEQQLKDVDLFDKLQPIMQQLPENERMPALLRFFGGDQERVLKFMQRGGRVFNYETPENKLKAEQAKKAQSEAEYMDLSSQALQQQLGVGGGGQAPQATPAQGRAQAVGGGGQGQMVTSGINFGPSGATINTINPQADYAQTMARKEAEKQVTLAPTIKVWDDYLNTLSRATAEMGGLGDSAIEAFAKGSTANLASKVSKMPETQALGKKLKSTALQMTTTVQGSRPSDTDLKAMLDVMPSNLYPAATNASLTRTIESLLDSGATSPSEGLLKSGIDQMQTIIDADKRFIKRALEAGATMEEINATLEQKHKERGW